MPLGLCEETGGRWNHFDVKNYELGSWVSSAVVEHGLCM